MSPGIIHLSDRLRKPHVAEAQGFVVKIHVLTLGEGRARPWILYAWPMRNAEDATAWYDQFMAVMPQIWLPPTIAAVDPRKRTAVLKDWTFPGKHKRLPKDTPRIAVGPLDGKIPPIEELKIGDELPPGVRIDPNHLEGLPAAVAERLFFLSQGAPPYKRPGE